MGRHEVREGWLVGLKGIAAYCGIHIDTLRRWMQDFKMPITKIGGRWCADPDALDEWLNYPHKKGQNFRLNAFAKKCRFQW